MRGILFSQMKPPEELAGDFHDWYESEHIPVRMALEGFEAARRYLEVDRAPSHLAVYELSDLGALETPAYAQLKRAPSERTARMLSAVRGFTRFTCDEAFDTGDPGEEHRFLSVVAFAVPDADRAEFDDFYETEHVALLMRADDWLRVRRYRVRSGEGGPWTDLALHELHTRAVMDSPERAAARAAPKRAALGSRPWFAASGRWLYERIATAR